MAKPDGHTGVPAREAAALFKDKKAVEGILKSPQAQALAGVLRQMDEEGLRSAAQGDGTALRDILRQVMADPAGARAVEELRQKPEG